MTPAEQRAALMLEDRLFAADLADARRLCTAVDQLTAEADKLLAELAALRQAASAIVDRDFTFFSGEMIGASRKITRAEVLALRAALAARKEPS
jgi:hypothetical protein